MPEPDNSFEGLWKHAISEGGRSSHAIDTIRRAADDFRMVRAARIMNGLEDFEVGYDIHEALTQVAGDYYLEPDGVNAALKMAGDRALRDQA